MLQNQKVRIALIGDSLDSGGAEKVQALLSLYFESKGIDVVHILVMDRITYTYAGEIVNLGRLKNKTNDIFNKIKRFNYLRRYFRNNSFNYIIDFRYKNNFIQELVTNECIYNAPLIFTIHSSILNFYIPENNLLAKLVFRKAHGSISVSDEVNKMVNKKNIGKISKRIYNPLDITDITIKSRDKTGVPEYKYILAAGRMQDDLKQFDKLIGAYSKSVLPENKIKLVILGEGTLKNKYIKQVQAAGLADMVVFPGFQENPYKYMDSAFCFVLCSKREGLGMVLAESLACGTPVISFDCVSGPSEIIEHEKNGLLVQNQDFDALTQAINRMYTDEVLYKYCKENATGSIQKFSLENIGRQWLEYLNINTNNNGNKYN